MITIKEISEERQQFIMTFHNPGRVEVSVVNGRIIAHGYDGIKIDLEQEPNAVYDGTITN